MRFEDTCNFKKCYHSISRLFVSGLIILMVFGCGGGGSSNDDDDTTPVPSSYLFNGVASKGLIGGGTVSVYEIGSDGQKAEPALGTAVTDENGSYSLSIDYVGPVIVEITGGTYTDEATGESVTLEEPLRAVLANVTGEVDVAITPLTELATRKAEIGGTLSPETIEASNELVSQLVGCSITETMPANPESADEFADGDEDQQNYALMLAAISQMAATEEGQDLSDILDAIEEDLDDLELDQTGADLSDALDEYIADEEHNTTGADSDDVDDLTGNINDARDGMTPTGNLGELKEYLIAFMQDSNDTNFNAFITYMETFTPDSGEAHLFVAIAELMDIYNSDACSFINGADGLDIGFGTDFDIIDLKGILRNYFDDYNYFENNDMKTLFAEIEARLITVEEHLDAADGINTSISLTGFDSVYFDAIDLTLLKSITKIAKSFCIYTQSVDLTIEDYFVTEFYDSVEDIYYGNYIFDLYEIEDDHINELLTNNNSFLTYTDTSTLANALLELKEGITYYQSSISALDALTESQRAKRFNNAFNIESEVDFWFAKAISEKVLPALLDAFADETKPIVFANQEYLNMEVIVADDGYSYYQENFAIKLESSFPNASLTTSQQITLFDLSTGSKNIRDFINIDLNYGDPYVTNHDLDEIFKDSVGDINWEYPITP